MAVAGDTLEVRSKKLFLNGREQIEPYVQHVFTDTMLPRTSPRDFFGPVVIPPGRIFMMGDNRDNSQDSRFWGPLPLENVRGKATIIYFSIDTAHGWLPPHLRLSRIGRLIR